MSVHDDTRPRVATVTKDADPDSRRCTMMFVTGADAVCAGNFHDTPCR
nr:hypothetical protein [Micrococcus lylae]